ncbi:MULTISPECIES: peptidoglycan DD-metalloendopeptidase family protein [unclassified Neisseria]|uniref:peptidoglycan DD-metalloendopeptidase family protein n=1 Tax=unclassified Neisseria TaxID=2623750 RepID=UPI001071C65D|nr:MULTISPECIES: peptidoglycan DD-metalloendopeptidase family protein [unclassified Neisseria]MBF0803257.1 peptidoglycan DD-metalloendopeptidase family protein [Neisseria sp. 19428wB4_WF04]TFU44096.1 LysM peptidoglycan-binding domain-containing protein [Neisseria sp. WF04]
MLKKTAFRTGTAVLVLMLGACSWFQQPAAPVTVGAASGASGTSAQSNPYGAAPYDPNAAGAVAAPEPYTPPATAAAAAPSGGGAYIPSNAPVDIHAATHTVVRGDTVYNIAKRYNITQDNVREWNNLSADNTISVGQNLRVKPAGYSAPAATAASKPAAPPSSASAATTPAPSNADYARSPQAASPAKTPTVSTGGVRTVSGIVWQRPTAGNIIVPFGGSSKGVDIAGQAGQAVVSAADGKVVYAGSGLRGYGNLVIVQHNPTFLTAYGHNQNLLVKEGQTVKRGQTIARMGSSDADRTKLHFEVRQNGKPVNPTQFVAF